MEGFLLKIIKQLFAIMQNRSFPASRKFHEPNNHHYSRRSRRDRRGVAFETSDESGNLIKICTWIFMKEKVKLWNPGWILSAIRKGWFLKSLWAWFQRFSNSKWLFQNFLLTCRHFWEDFRRNHEMLYSILLLVCYIFVLLSWKEALAVLIC